MAQFKITSSETVYYTIMVEANTEDEAIDKAFSDNHLPYWQEAGIGDWQVDKIERLENE